MNRLSGKVALVTGAAQGMGETHAVMLAQEGAQVVLTDINEAQGREIAEKIGDQALFIQQDVTSQEDWQSVVATRPAAFWISNCVGEQCRHHRAYRPHCRPITVRLPARL